MKIGDFNETENTFKNTKHPRSTVMVDIKCVDNVPTAALLKENLTTKSFDRTAKKDKKDTIERKPYNKQKKSV